MFSVSAHHPRQTMEKIRVILEKVKAGLTDSTKFNFWSYLALVVLIIVLRLLESWILSLQIQMSEHWQLWMWVQHWVKLAFLIGILTIITKFKIVPAVLILMLVSAPTECFCGIRRLMYYSYYNDYSVIHFSYQAWVLSWVISVVSLLFSTLAPLGILAIIKRFRGISADLIALSLVTMWHIIDHFPFWWVGGFIFYPDGYPSAFFGSFPCLLGIIVLSKVIITTIKQRDTIQQSWKAKTAKQRCGIIGGILIPVGLVLCLIGNYQISYNKSLKIDADLAGYAFRDAMEQGSGYTDASREKSNADLRLRTSSYSLPSIIIFFGLGGFSCLFGFVLIVVGWILPEQNKPEQ